MIRPTRPWARLALLGFARRARRVTRSGDGGATLIYALVFITIAAVALGAILAFADTSMRTTIALRSEAARGAAADGAAQIAINSLRHGTFTDGSCQSVSLPGFYTAVNGAGTYSANVICTRDDAHSTGPAPGSGLDMPDNAILTLGRSPSEEGLVLTANGAPNSIRIKGAIFSNSNIRVNRLVSTSSVSAHGHCDGSITPAATCDIPMTVDPPGSDDPDYSKPTASTALQSVPSCRGDNNTVTFTPGLYTDLTNLNKLTRRGGQGCHGVFWFPHGVYYFDFDGTWTVDNGYLVGGTPPGGGPMPDGVPTIPGACQSPIPPDPLPPGGWSDPGRDKGVVFVFGGQSQLVVDRSLMEICGNEATSGPPIAIYGLKSPVGPVTAQSGCVVAVGGCSFLATTQSPRNKLFVNGTTYAPNAAIDVRLNNRTGQVFGGGVIARRLSVNATASADTSEPIISLPGSQPVDTIVYLAVYVCPGTSPCAQTSSNLQLKVKVGLLDPSGTPVAGKRQVTVYAWSVQR